MNLVESLSTLETSIFSTLRLGDTIYASVNSGVISASNDLSQEWCQVIT